MTYQLLDLLSTLCVCLVSSDKLTTWIVYLGSGRGGVSVSGAWYRVSTHKCGRQSITSVIGTGWLDSILTIWSSNLFSLWWYYRDSRVSIVLRSQSICYFRDNDCKSTTLDSRLIIFGYQSMILVHYFIRRDGMIVFDTVFSMLIERVELDWFWGSYLTPRLDSFDRLES